MEATAGTAAARRDLFRKGNPSPMTLECRLEMDELSFCRPTGLAQSSQERAELNTGPSHVKGCHG